MVTAVVRMNGCASLGPANAKLAETTMNRLVEGCSSVPGGRVQLIATLQPNGQIELAAPEGQPQTVPLCVLKHALTHKVTLQKACQLEVTLEQTGVQVAGAADASAD
jgi:hypothetical protein